jgi:hypothetical protein
MIKPIALALFVTLPALADISVTPTSGSQTGGDVVTVSGLTCTDCSTATIRFGGVASPRVTAVSSGTVQAITPPHVPGTVAVTSDAGSGSPSFTYVSTFVSSNYERVLIPLSLGAGQFPGAYGSLWASELWIFNGNPWTGEVLWGNPDATCCPKNVLEAGEMRKADYVASTQTPFGLVAWLQKGSSRGMTFSLQVRDVSRAKLHSGTEMPLVHESEFHESIDLLNVPIEPASSRAALRVFNLDAPNQIPIRIVITPAAGGDPLVDDSTVFLRIAGVGGSVPSFARFVSLDDLAARYPQIANAGRVQISVSTGTDAKVWAFAAITNNATQLITTVLPH